MKAKQRTEVKMADGWHYNTGAFEDDDCAGPKPVWSADGYPTRDAARAAKRVLGRSSMAERLATLDDADPETKAATDALIHETQKVVDSPTHNVVGCLSQATMATETTETAAKPQEKMMTFTFKSLSKNGKNAFYTGGATVLRFALSAFPNKQRPDSFEVADGVFAAPKASKAEQTPEEKAAAKAARAAKPKPTLAERIEQRRKALEALEAKLAKGATQPSL